MSRHSTIRPSCTRFMMPEWYPHVLFVSKFNAHRATDRTNVLKCYYPEDITLFEREFITAEQAAYRETTIEDKDICQQPMESGMDHFHLRLRAQLELHLEPLQTT